MGETYTGCIGGNTWVSMNQRPTVPHYVIYIEVGIHEHSYQYDRTINIFMRLFIQKVFHKYTEFAYNKKMYWLTKITASKNHASQQILMTIAISQMYGMPSNFNTEGRWTLQESHWVFWWGLKTTFHTVAIAYRHIKRKPKTTADFMYPWRVPNSFSSKTNNILHGLTSTKSPWLPSQCVTITIEDFPGCVYTHITVQVVQQGPSHPHWLTLNWSTWCPLMETCLDNEQNVDEICFQWQD